MKLLIGNEIDKMWRFILKIYGTEDCRLCNKRIKCIGDQFIKKNGKVKCTQCERYLEPVKEK